MKQHKQVREVAEHSEGKPDPKTIELRAYELYVERGGEGGHDSEDWLRAEVELKQRGGASHAKIVG